LPVQPAQTNPIHDSNNTADNVTTSAKTTLTALRRLLNQAKEVGSFAIAWVLEEVMAISQMT
jgi:hypothetical protein